MQLELLSSIFDCLVYPNTLRETLKTSCISDLDPTRFITAAKLLVT
ncbi:hypothetical protein TGAM01_v209649 [Trichoderma gamsii]|uniref:Uncharacterized protein n=1 Tax=Trichoderma gamsii TaxID=398673 RepID=A0A2P4ZB53_9HYPO|nr:hypothetical protein TGAM01_v209649 [Trichoderma gamsii]PON21486.1 hypothetical protein TGAM01_v209649 [Trichoderma gamsii]